MRDPTPEAKQHSIKVTNYIKQKIQQAGGAISFAKFMQAALYAPNLGYYNAGCTKFGRYGDFITAPMLGTLFAACVANQCLSILTTTPKSDILELGAGDGQLANNLTRHLVTQYSPSIFNNYFILEPSHELQARQKKLLLNNDNYFYKNYKNKIFWLEQLPTNFNGVILANEVLDALPVSLFTIKNNSIWEKLVTLNNDEFAFIEQLANKSLTTAITKLPISISNYTTNSYSSEICLLLPGLIKSLAHTLQQGAILLFDYGFLEHEYYNSARNAGTLMCYYQHHAHPDPFFFPGLQDITAYVNFSLIIKHAIETNLEIAGFSSMANFLIQNDLQTELNKIIITDVKQQINLNQEVHTLISPNEMGEIFKALLLVKK